MSYIFEEPPDETEKYENLDEALDELDLPGHGEGPEGGRDIDADLVADQTALEQAGANLDDPDRISMLDGGMDDPDGSGPRPHRGASWRDETEEVVDPTESEGDPDLEVIDTDATDMDQVPDDAPRPDSSRS